MPRSLANILVHIIFSTKERYPFLKNPTPKAPIPEGRGSYTEGCPFMKTRFLRRRRKAR